MAHNYLVNDCFTVHFELKLSWATMHMPNLVINWLLVGFAYDYTISN